MAFSALCRLVLAFVCLAFFTAIAGASPTTVHQQSVLLIDSFQTAHSNDLGVWHGTGEGLRTEYGSGYVTFYPTTADQNFHTQLTMTCLDLAQYEGMYLHVFYSGTDKFTISLSQNNADCNPGASPYPETWDSVEASRYAQGPNIYIPLSHFDIDQSRALSVSFSGFYTTDEVTLYLVEITDTIPVWFDIPEKLPTGTLVQKCKRPNSFAFGIDDGLPELAQEAMRILKEEDILVTFFTVGSGLEDPDANFTSVYQEMLERGHQVALHTYTHPPYGSEFSSTGWRSD